MELLTTGLMILLSPLLSGAIISGGGGAMASRQISAEGVIRQLRAIGKQKVCRRASDGLHTVSSKADVMFEGCHASIVLPINKPVGHIELSGSWMGIQSGLVGVV